MTNPWAICGLWIAGVCLVVYLALTELPSFIADNLS
jgi:hypothetical protein